MLATVGAVGSGGQKLYPLALWLVPAQEQRRRIQEIISGLARHHSSSAHYIPVFQPHATLCVGELQNKDFADGLRALFGQVDTFSARQKEISLAVRADQPIDQRKKQWSQFLFLALDIGGAPPEALDLRATRKTFPAISNLKLSTDANDPQIPMLHVSLMYNGIENSFGGIAQEVTNKYKYDLPDQLVFESIQVVMPRSGDWRDILKEHPDANGNWDVIFNRKLQPRAPSKPLRMVIAGGQTGVDHAAWRAARSRRVLIGGWCPPHRDIGRGRRVPDDFPCQETPDDTSATAPDVPRSERTQWNVRDADATLILRGRNQASADKGTQFTIQSAAGCGRPFLICDPKDSKEVDRVVSWIQRNEVRILNVGGPSEDTERGIGAIAEEFLSKVFSQVRNAKD